MKDYRQHSTFFVLDGEPILVLDGQRVQLRPVRTAARC
jgi:uncharacterized cupin superfamily protein